MWYICRMEALGLITIKLIHASIGVGVGIAALAIIRLARLAKIYDSQQDELEALGKRLGSVEQPLSDAEAKFGIACALVEAARIAVILGCATWLAVAL